MTWKEADEAVQREQELTIAAELAAAQRKPIPRTKLGASIWQLMGWCWMLHRSSFSGTAPPVNQQLP